MSSNPIMITYQVWNSPEFKAFAELLGIDTDVATEYLQIEMRPGEPVRVTQEFMPRIKGTGPQKSISEGEKTGSLYPYKGLL